ncbi:MAG: DegV family protein [Oscillospiraceae bacterium]|jgi:DegV family protein with EDD domain|nr:DegV family protein [Oscillospiraceae bacterium]
MADFVITCCSTADLPREYFAERNVSLAYFKYTIDGTTYVDDLGESMTSEDFFARVAGGAQPVTTQVNVAEYTLLFEQFLKEGTDVLHVTLSSGISGSYGSAKIAQADLQAKYPERKLYVVDSLAASSGYGLLMDKLLDMRDEGKSIGEIYEWAEANKLKLNHWFFATDLHHLKRGGRISGATAVVGTILNICPIMNMNHEGKLTPRTKARGKKNAIDELVRNVVANAEGRENYDGKCFLCHSACMDDAVAMAAALKKAMPNIKGDVMINNIGTTIGSHTGVGTVAVFTWGDKRID